MTRDELVNWIDRIRPGQDYPGKELLGRKIDALLAAQCEADAQVAEQYGQEALEENLAHHHRDIANAIADAIRSAAPPGEPDSLPDDRAMTDWTRVEDGLPDFEQIVTVRMAHGVADKYAWGARIDGGEGWLWGIHYGGGICPAKDAVWNHIEADDEYLVTHWAPLLKPPSTSSEG